MEAGEFVVVDYIHKSPRLRRLHDLRFLRLRAEESFPVRCSPDFGPLHAIRRFWIPRRIPPHAA